jgi:hypothetical protein
VQSEKARLSPLLLLVTTLFALIIAFHLGNALLGKSLFRAVHLGTALEYSHGPINLLKPVIVGFNATETPTAQELPIWQAAAGFAFKLTHSNWYGWANLVSLLFFSMGLWPFFQLARQYVGERAAWWTMAFFLTQPLIVIMAGEASTDGFCLVATIWFLFFADKMIRTGNLWWWLPAALFAALSAISKLPFFMAAGLCSIFILAGINIRAWRSWTLLAGVGIFAAGIFFVWTHYTNALSAQALYPYQELRISQSPNMAFWYFGDLHYRLSPGPWLKGGWRFLHATLGSLPLVALLLTALLQSGNRMPKLWLLATILTMLVFTHLVLVHWHYYLMCCPAVAMLCGVTLTRWEKFWAQEMPKTWLRFSLMGLILIFSTIDGVIATKISIYYDPYPQQMSSLIRQNTKPDDKLVLYGGDWGGEELFRAGRKGFYVFSLESLNGETTCKGLNDLLASEADLRQLKSLGYNKLVLMSESPVRFAAVAVNPGSKRKRLYYPATISQTVDAWPVVYRSEDILLKEIP